MEALKAAIQNVKDKILEEDYAAATSAVEDARTAFPNLPDLGHLAVLCGVLHLSGLDWHRLLRLPPSASPSDVALRHLLLSSEIAPLGLDFSGASQAFALLDEARSALTTRHRRGGWTAEDLVPGQIWAVRDGSVRFPRRYVEVVNWGSVTDSEASVFFLEPHPTRDEEMRWVEEGLPLVCGMFRASKEIARIELSMFSHRVSCDHKLGKSFYRIRPKKGEIWAIYADWSGDLGVVDQANCAYRVVEIASEFEGEEGEATVAGLVEVEGCRTFFERETCDGFRPTRRVSRVETALLASDSGF
ncbi:hypothetical protein QJS10_CPA08g00417 [Acorus calamus]|uniref:DUF3444 domain-containing protein n=1 Tax=Acorus calamus TaxID=4465 RepID=A0AAV9EAC7_ACOCL|nr:hypothetical protein QJS10_CPA08g00417 [Acorus calamus]